MQSARYSVLSSTVFWYYLGVHGSTVLQLLFQLAAADFFVVIGIESERNIYLHGCRKSYFTFIFERQFCFYIICNLELSISC